jgi:excisionase family DNA binding protein
MTPADPAPVVLALGLRATAKALSVSERTAWQLIKDQRIRCVRVGTRIIVPIREIEAFLEREAQAQAAPDGRRQANGS